MQQKMSVKAGMISITGIYLANFVLSLPTLKILWMAFFDDIDVLLFPSQWKESFGLTVREALAWNVWVIATDAGGVVEDLVNGENASIIPLDGDHVPLQHATELYDYFNALLEAQP